MGSNQGTGNAASVKGVHMNTNNKSGFKTKQYIANNSQGQIDTNSLSGLSGFNTAYLMLFIIVALYAINKGFLIAVNYIRVVSKRRKFLRIVKEQKGEVDVLTSNAEGVPVLIKTIQEDGRNFYRFM